MVNLRLVQFSRVIQSFCKYFISSVSYRNMSEIIFHWRGSGRLPISICETKEYFPRLEGLRGELYSPGLAPVVLEDKRTKWDCGDTMSLNDDPVRPAYYQHRTNTTTTSTTISSSPTPSPPPPPQTPGWSGLFVLLTTTLMTRSKVLRQPKVRIKTDLILCPFH